MDFKMLLFWEHSSKSVKGERVPTLAWVTATPLCDHAIVLPTSIPLALLLVSVNVAAMFAFSVTSFRDSSA